MSDFKSNQNSFFTISRTAEIIGVQSHVLRFWEKKFSSINPKKSLSGRRFYSSNDIEALLKIKKLLYEDGFTIQQHEILSEKIKEIDSKGAYFVLTNSNTELVKDIYFTQKNFSLHKISVSRSINQMGKDESESGTKEILITNFKVPIQMKLGI